MSKTAAAHTAPVMTDGARALAVDSTALANLHLASEAPPELGLLVRKSADEPNSYARLRASVFAVGILCPLLIKRHKGKSYVTAGNRRLLIMREKHAGQEATTFIPTVDDATIAGESRELAVMHNISLPMHPIDQYEVISGAISGGMSIEDAAMRWGFTTRRAQQIMAFGCLAEEVREAWRQNEIDAKCAQAFTLGPPDEQRKVLARYRKDGNGSINDHAVRSVFVGKQSDVGPKLEFVGIEAYEAAGGRAVRDLFELNHTVSDTKMLHRMAEEKIAVACRELEGAGWKWAMASPADGYNYGRTEPAKKKPTDRQREMLKAAKYSEDFRMQRMIETEINRDSFSAPERAKLGCFVSISKYGELKVDAGRVKPDEARKVAAGDRAAARKYKTKVAEAAGGAPLVSNALMQRLSETLTEAAAAALAATPQVAMAAILAGAASMDKACAITETGLTTKKGGRGKLHSFESVFASMMKLKPAQLGEHVAGLAAKALDFQTMNGEPPLKNKAVAALIDKLEPKTFNAALAREFDAADYFGSVNRAMMLMAVKEIGLGPDAEKSVGKMPKADAVEFMTKAAKKAGWLPISLRTSHCPPISKAKK